MPIFEMLLLILSLKLQCSADDGYLSEGGASFYAKKIQSRIALEKQKTVEEQNRNLEANKRPLPGKDFFLVYDVIKVI